MRARGGRGESEASPNSSDKRKAKERAAQISRDNIRAQIEQVSVIEIVTDIAVRQ